MKVIVSVVSLIDSPYSPPPNEVVPCDLEMLTPLVLILGCSSCCVPNTLLNTVLRVLAAAATYLRLVLDAEIFPILVYA